MTDRKDFTPHPYQRQLIDHILDTPRCAVWADMGMGKTVSSLTALSGLYAAGETHPSLVLAPLRVARDTWPDEVRKWSHLSGLDVVPIVGSLSERLAALKFDAPVYTCNYDNLVWLVEHFGDRWPFRTLLPDESTRLKNLRLSFRTSRSGNEYLAGQGGKRARALGRIAHTKIDRVIEATGTPSPNGLIDLWGQMWFLDGGKRLGRTFSGFKERFFRPKPDGFGSMPLPHSREEIQHLLRDLCITVEAKDWFDVKEPLVRTVEVTLPVKARSLYRDMEKELFMSVEGHDVEVFNAAAKTMKCLQLANGAAYVDDKGTWKGVHDEKIEALEDIVEEANGETVLVAYHFKSDRERLLRAFPKAIDVATADGLRAAKQGKGRVWIGHPASMGHGIDGLQEHCYIAAIFGHWWDLEQYQQFIGRIGPVRQIQSGFDRVVRIYNIVAKNTVDELVIARRETKREVQDLLREAMKVRR